MTDNPKNAVTTAATSSWPLLRRLWREYMRGHVGKLSLAILCMAVVALTTAAQALLVKPALDRIMVQGDAKLVWLLPLAFMGVILVKGAASYFQSLLMEKLALRIIEAIQGRMFERLIGADLAYIDRNASGTLISRFISDIYQLREMLTTSIVSLVRDNMTTSALIGVMVYTNWRMALIALIAFPFSAWFITSIGRRMRRVFRTTQAETGEMTRMLDDAFKGIRQVKAYAMEEHERQRAGRTFYGLYRLMLKATRVRALSVPALETMGGVVFAGVLAFGGWQVLHGQATVGSFMAFFAAALMAYQPMRRVLNTNITLQRGLASSERVFEIVDLEHTIRERPDAVPLKLSGGAVRLDGVGFSYGDGAPALRDVTIEAPAGKVTALVGPSGAGKSTVLNLIPRFYDATAGAVTIDGQDVRAVTLDSLRGAIGLVTQDTGLFNDTIRANIAYGKVGASDAEIAAAARAAAADEFIRALPQGYDTEIGERGITLSGGQRQRLSIARALLKNAPILLLDEATSALDTESERQVQDALKRLMKGRTSIVIAHRLSTVMDADIIYVIDRGRVVESGGHDELVARDGLYARLNRMQFRDAPPADAEARTEA